MSKKSDERQHIINYIKNFDKFDELDLHQLKRMENFFNRINREIKKKNVKKVMAKRRNDVDKTTEKYQLLLEYVNGILANVDKPNIDDLTDFKDIDRLDIIKDENVDLLDEMAPRLFEHFNKNKCGYYRRTEGFALNCLRGMCKEIGLILTNRRVTKSDSFRTFSAHFFYSII